jgi:hypothetical protein
VPAVSRGGGTATTNEKDVKMKKYLRRCCAGLAVAAAMTAAQAAPTTFVTTGQVWSYSTLTVDLWSDWAGAGIAQYAQNNGVWNNGASAFGSGGTFATAWTAGTDLAMTTSFEFSGGVTGALNLHVASDNGFIVFLNGVQLAKENAEGFTSYWEYEYALDPALLQQGTNVLQVLAEDHGGITFFDMQLDANVSAVPEPAMPALLGTALLALVAARRRRR